MSTATAGFQIVKPEGSEPKEKPGRLVFDAADVPMYEWVRATAEANGISMTEVVRQAVAYAMSAQKE